MDHDITALAATAVACLRVFNRTLATAESCTGGLIAATITEVPGASEVFHYGWVTYSNEAKQKLLRVPRKLIAAHGVVSEEVVLQMARSVRKICNADYIIAVSGNAGPTAEPGGPPVGTVCLAIGTLVRVLTATLHFDANLSRAEIRRRVVHEALEVLIREVFLEGVGRPYSTRRSYTDVSDDPNNDD